MTGGLLDAEVVPVAADDCRHFEFEVEQLASRWHGHRIVGADQAVRVGEVEGGDLVPLAWDTAPPDARIRAHDVLLERDEVPDGYRLHGRQQANRIQGYGTLATFKHGVLSQHFEDVGIRGQWMDLIVDDYPVAPLPGTVEGSDLHGRTGQVRVLSFIAFQL